MTKSGVLAVCWALAACGAINGAPIAPSHEAPDAPHATDMEMITSEQAAGADLVEDEVSLEFSDEDTDGTAMLSSWLAEARARGSRRVGEIELHVVRDKGEQVVDCRTLFYPKTTVVPTEVPATTQLVTVTRPVLKSVTYYEQRCRLVSKPYTRTETTYSYQYDYFTKSSRSVPQTRMVTDYRMENECHTEPVQRLETHYEFGTEWHYVPPRTDWLVEKKLRETAPVCTAVDGPRPSSRVRGTIYVAQGAVDGVSTDSSGSTKPYNEACVDAYRHVSELAQAWVEWHPGSTARSLPPRMEFLSVCHSLSPEQQRCLVMPAGRTNHAGCQHYFDKLAPSYKARLDGLLLDPETDDDAPQADGGAPRADGGAPSGIDVGY